MLTISVSGSVCVSRPTCYLTITIHITSTWKLAVCSGVNCASVASAVVLVHGILASLECRQRGAARRGAGRGGAGTPSSLALVCRSYSFVAVQVIAEWICKEVVLLGYVSKPIKITHYILCLYNFHNNSDKVRRRR